MFDERTEHVFRTIDTMDAAAVADLFADEATVVFGNGEPMVGRDAVRAGIGGFFSTIAGLRHQIVNAWLVDADTIAETEVTYRRLDGREAAISAVSIWHTATDGRIDDYRIFVDLAPLYAP
jgi:ketosteroid isomerase-like protein